VVVKLIHFQQLAKMCYFEVYNKAITGRKSTRVVAVWINQVLMKSLRAVGMYGEVSVHCYWLSK